MIASRRVCVNENPTPRHRRGPHDSHHWRADDGFLIWEHQPRSTVVTPGRRALRHREHRAPLAPTSPGRCREEPVRRAGTGASGRAGGAGCPARPTAGCPGKQGREGTAPGRRGPGTQQHRLARSRARERPGAARRRAKVRWARMPLLLGQRAFASVSLTSPTEAVATHPRPLPCRGRPQQHPGVFGGIADAGVSLSVQVSAQAPGRGMLGVGCPARGSRPSDGCLPCTEGNQ